MGMFHEQLQATVSETNGTTACMELAKGPITLFAKPLTAADMMSIKRAHPDFGSNPTLEGMIDLMILKCRNDDADGQRAFDKLDKPLLLRMNMNLIGQVFSELFGTQIDATNNEGTVDEKK